MAMLRQIETLEVEWDHQSLRVNPHLTTQKKKFILLTKIEGQS